MSGMTYTNQNKTDKVLVLVEPNEIGLRYNTHLGLYNLQSSESAIPSLAPATKTNNHKSHSPLVIPYLSEWLSTQH